ncbi:hypothetical protein [Rubrivivax gelatinosus]|uniref:hypothetical protein n=1 Tax=Rubrivivax gelatinosus TaxID=28068 RepID=UPI0013898E9F|nr:hypothetical protein [Rubrivivax gelatinosus]
MSAMVTVIGRAIGTLDARDMRLFFRLSGFGCVQAHQNPVLNTRKKRVSGFECGFQQ